MGSPALDNSWSSSFNDALNLSDKPSVCPTSSTLGGPRTYGKSPGAVAKTAKQRQNMSSSLHSAFSGGAAATSYTTTLPMCKPGYTSHTVGSGVGSEHNVRAARNASTLSEFARSQKAGGRRKKKRTRARSKRKTTRSRRRRHNKRTRHRGGRLHNSIHNSIHNNRRLHRRKCRSRKKTGNAVWGCYS